ncbi:hypothetical protein TIFTF001_025459 [Ficus carica]|uniref:SBP-type domain-containing protein n=1 Tax=Ficus carica TaxID=3494 RepID=A0AA88APY4_FICCA|nr:hypothetical protein TIFTF001_025459 [Ficus carica]
MLDYEWGNPSAIMLAGEEAEQHPGSDPSRQNILEHFASAQTAFNDHNTHFLSSTPHHHHHHNHSHHHHHHDQTNNNPSVFAHHHFNGAHHHTQSQPQQHQQQQHHQFQVHSSLYDVPRAYAGASSYASASILSLDPITGAGGGGGSGGGGGAFMLVPKSEDHHHRAAVDFSSRIGLNLGGRTYFSSEDDFMSRLYRRPRALEAGSSAAANSPRCQAEGCNADLSHAKHYHRRHKVCEFHSKASTVIAAGLTQRFCQQCSRFHLLSEFDNGKRSCRKRLADHNRRRRKTQQPTQPENPKSPQPENARNPPSDNVARSPPDSGAQSSSSVTVAVSPPRMSLDCFRQRSYQTTTASSGSSSSLFFSKSYGRHGWFKVYIHSRHWHYSTFLSGAGIFPENAVNM